MINNLELIKPLLNFEKRGDFYMLYVFKRKKDQPEGERDNHQSVRTIKTYCIESIDHLDRRWDEIVQMCEMFKARAYIHVQNGNHNQKGLFDSVVGQIKTQEKRWIVDVDTTSQHIQNMISNIIEMVKPNDGGKIITKIPTKNGVHLITKRFDVMEFNKQIKERGKEIPDIQKKNPTLLYYPNSL
jgi:hypothetical protein